MTEEVYPVMIELERVRALVRSLGKSHDLKVIAEGVEGEGQFDLLREEM